MTLFNRSWQSWLVVFTFAMVLDSLLGIDATRWTPDGNTFYRVAVLLACQIFVPEKLRFFKHEEPEPTVVVVQNFSADDWNDRVYRAARSAARTWDK